MHALRWIRFAFVLALLVGGLPHAAAQDGLPAKMAGTWNGITPGKGTPFGGDWSVVVEKQEGGGVEGKVNWVGRFCAIENEPFTGKFDGTTLTLAVQLPADAQAVLTCGAASPVGVRIAARIARMSSSVAARGFIFTCPLFIAHSASRSRSASVFT